MHGSLPRLYIIAVGKSAAAELRHIRREYFLVNAALRYAEGIVFAGNARKVANGHKPVPFLIYALEHDNILRAVVGYDNYAMAVYRMVYYVEGIDDIDPC